MKDSLQQSYRDIALGNKVFIESITFISEGSSPKRGFFENICRI